jgi:hypothetical protein
VKKVATGGTARAIAYVATEANHSTRKAVQKRQRASALLVFMFKQYRIRSVTRSGPTRQLRVCGTLGGRGGGGVVVTIPAFPCHCHFVGVLNITTNTKVTGGKL